MFACEVLHVQFATPNSASFHGSISGGWNVAVATGFTSKQAYKMGIPSIGIVAVLVANVTFIAWATPPGDSILLLLLLFGCSAR